MSELGAMGFRAGQVKGDRWTGRDRKRNRQMVTGAWGWRGWAGGTLEQMGVRGIR